MKNVAYVYHPDYLLHIPPFEHPESPDRLIAINQHLESVGLLGTLVPVRPDYLDNGEILRVHDPDYLRKLELACRRGDLTLDSEDTYLSKNSYSVACSRRREPSRGPRPSPPGRPTGRSARSDPRGTTPPAPRGWGSAS